VLLVDSTFTSRGYGGIAEDNRNFVRNITERVEATLLYDKGANIQSRTAIVLKHSLRSLNKMALITNRTIPVVTWKDNSYQTHITGLKTLSKNGTTFLRVHDIFPLSNPEWFTINGRRIFHLGSRNIARGTVLVCNSESTKLEAARHPFFRHLESIVLPCEINPKTGALPCESCWVCNNPPLTESYLLAVGTIEPRKNYMALVEAWAIAKRHSSFDRLIIAGRAGWKNRDAIARLLKEHRVMWLTPCQSGLQQLYQNASGFISASLGEGFDIPSMEARSYGLDLALSDIPVHRELLSDASLFFDPNSVRSIALSITLLNPTKHPRPASNLQADYHLKFQTFLDRMTTK